MSHSIDELASKCIRCGFCLEACPTFVVSGKETESPRGRIYLAKNAEAGEIEWSEARESIDTCLGCLACMPACPSGVDYSGILELARERVEKTRPLASRLTRNALLKVLTAPRLLREFARLLQGKRPPSLVSRLLSGEPPQAEMPTAKVGGYSAHYPEPTSRVFSLQGCVMDALYSKINAATVHVLRLNACEVVPISGCCGALHLHSGNSERANVFAKRIHNQLPKDATLITNSAGCGSALKEALENCTVEDISEFLAKLPLRKAANAQKLKVTYHDACHLAHAQRIKDAPRRLILSVPGVELVELDEADRCCGSAGIYNLTEPTMARNLLERKWSFIQETGASIVLTGNPGCLAWIEQRAKESDSTVRVMHTVEFLADCYDGTLAE